MGSIGFTNNITLTRDAIDYPLTLLWTNPSPTSAFSAQTLNLNLNNYNAILILSTYSTSYSTLIFENIVFLVPEIKDGTIQTRIHGWGRDNNYNLTRYYTITNTSIAIDGGAYNGSNNTSYMIPWKIYGIKF